MEGFNNMNSRLVGTNGFRCRAAIGEVKDSAFAVVVGERKVQYLQTQQRPCCSFCVDKHPAFLVLLPCVRCCLR